MWLWDEWKAPERDPALVGDAGTDWALSLLI